MSNARITTSKYSDMKVVKINGRTYYLDKIVAIEKTDSSTFRVTHANGQVFSVWGGKASGGHGDEWYVDGWPSGKSIECTSLADALQLLHGM
jgi:hypothetical protein